MGTMIRAKLSEKNKYWISKHRYYELKHFCLQYPSWKKAYAALDDLVISSPKLDILKAANGRIADPTANCAILKIQYEEKIKMVEQAAIEADYDLHTYILKAVTEDLSYNYLKTVLDMPCGKDMYYDRYRKFFWLLSKERD